MPTLRYLGWDPIILELKLLAAVFGYPGTSIPGIQVLKVGTSNPGIQAFSCQQPDFGTQAWVQRAGTSSPGYMKIFIYSS